MGKAESKGNVVVITGSKGRWELLVNGELFHLRGVGVSHINGRYQKADYLKLAKEMGATAVRTWGVEQGTREYLDRAHDYGLYVSAGIWLNPVSQNGTGSYLRSDLYKQQLKNKVLDYVRKNKDHPAILFWNIGNEVLFWTDDEKERVAFCRFLEEIVRAVHQIDPNHLVVYTSAAATAIPYMKEHVPSLDIFGVNAYGGFDKIHYEIIAQLDIPYLVTEFGPLGNWDKSKDLNGVAVESPDNVKAHDYKVHAHQIREFYGHCLGGFAFLLGDTTQVSASWWNLTHGKYPKRSYFAMKAFYTEEETENPSPVIQDMVMSKRKDLLPGEGIDVEVILRPYEEGDLRYQYFATTASEVVFFEEYPNSLISIRVLGKGEKVKIYAPSFPGIYRVYTVVTDGSGAASVFNKSISVIAQK